MIWKSGEMAELNELKVNDSKSGFVVWGRLPSYYPWLQELTVGDSTIRRQKSVKYLGVIIDETLSFSEHVQCISSKVARNIGMIRKLKHQFPQKVLRLLYFSLVHPYLLYCCSVWSGTFYVHLKPLRVLQNSAVRAIYGIDRLASVRNIYPRVLILPFSGLCLFYKLQLMYDIINNIAPMCLRHMFETAADVHGHLTRQVGMYRRPIRVFARSAFSARHILPVLWFQTPSSIRDIAERSGISEQLRHHCLQVYEF